MKDSAGKNQNDVAFFTNSEILGNHQLTPVTMMMTTLILQVVVVVVFRTRNQHGEKRKKDDQLRDRNNRKYLIFKDIMHENCMILKLTFFYEMCRICTLNFHL